MSAKSDIRLRSEEWDFSKLLDDEITIAGWWEYLREIPEAVEAIKIERRWKHRQEKNLKLSKCEMSSLELVYRLPYTFYADSNWPAEAFLALPREVRTSIVKAHDWPDGARPLPEVTIGEIAETQRAFPEYSLQDWVSDRIFTEDRQLHSEIITVAIDWRRSDESLTQSFSALLRERRPTDVSAYDLRGAGSRVRQIKHLLKALGALRLLRVMSWKDAVELTVSVSGKPLYQQLESVWRRAQSEAAGKISSIRKKLTSEPWLTGDAYRLEQELGGYSKESA